MSFNLTTASAMTDTMPPGGLALSDNRTGVDPQFVDAGANDFHLATGSPGIDTGITLPEVTVDHEGCTRPMGAGYDVGAYER